MDRPEGAVQLALCGDFHLTRSPLQIIAYHFEYGEPFRKGRIRPAVCLGAVQIPPRLLSEPKSIGYMELALVRLLPFNVLDIAHGGLEALCDKAASNLLTFLVCQRNGFLLLAWKPLNDLKALRGPAVAADSILKPLLLHTRFSQAAIRVSQYGSDSSSALMGITALGR